MAQESEQDWTPSLHQLKMTCWKCALGIRHEGEQRRASFPCPAPAGAPKRAQGGGQAGTSLSSFHHIALCPLHQAMRLPLHPQAQATSCSGQLSPGSREPTINPPHAGPADSAHSQAAAPPSRLLCALWTAVAWSLGGSEGSCLSPLSPGPSMGVEKLTWGAARVEGSQPQPPGCQLTSAKGVLMPGPEHTAVMCVMGAPLGGREGGARTGQIPHLETLLLPRGSCPLKGS